MNRIVEEDIQRVLSQCPFLDGWRGKTVMITGATGLIGRSIVYTLLNYNKQHRSEISVIAYVRNFDKANQLFADYANDKNLQIIVGDILSPILYSGKVDALIHTASTTASADFVQHPVETIKTALSGTDNVLQFAHTKGIQKVVYLSSLEVYGTPDTFEVTEHSLGTIDWTQVRSSYSEGKRMVECLCRSYAEEYQVPVVIARLAQTFGAGIDNTDQRVYAQFARAVVNQTDIILKTKGETVRNYCYLSDAVAALLYLVEKGEKGEIYNVANENTTCSIAEMATMVATLSNGKTKVVFDTSADSNKLGYLPTFQIKLLSNKLRALGWTPIVNLTDAFQKTIQSIQL